MRKYPILSLLLFAIVTAGCSVVPRTTTPEERAVATTTLATVEAVVVALRTTGHITVEQAALAQQQIAQLRIEVADSAETPLAWPDIYARVLTLAIAWLPPPQ